MPTGLRTASSKALGRFRRRMAPAIHVGRAVAQRLLLRNARINAHAYWPDGHGLEHVLLAALLAFTPYHPRGLEIVCSHASKLRRLRRRGRAAAGKVLHVTCSFDLGGTQTQIKNLCD